MEWISVDEKDIPENKCIDIWVRLVGGYHHGDEDRISDCFYNSKEKCFWKWCDRGVNKMEVCPKEWATHWMQIEPPKP